VTDRYIEAEVAVNANVVQRRRVLLSDAGDTPTTTAAGVGSVPATLAQSGQVVATEYGNGVVHQTVLTLAALAQTVVNGTEYQGTKIYSFPEGRILVLGVTASLAPTTTSTIATTLNSGVTGAVAVGTAAASNVSLTSTMVDLLPSTAFVTSTVINEPAAAVGAALAASAHFDGHSSHKDVYLNSAFATTTDVDADATMTWAGNITITWAFLGDY
jgi:hypothetical protein